MRAVFHDQKVAPFAILDDVKAVIPERALLANARLVFGGRVLSQNALGYFYVESKGGGDHCQLRAVRLEKGVLVIIAEAENHLRFRGELRILAVKGFV